VDTKDTNDRGRFQTAGQRLDSILGDASKQIEQQTQALIEYINDEVVPLIRQNSSKGLHVAADKLKEFADYMDSKKERK
jgi:ABC-type uncharacterized transport system substrate-binding protein